MKTLLALTSANLKGLSRDRAALFWTFFFPVMFVLLFGVLFSGSGDSKVSVGFVDLDQSLASHGIQTALSGEKVPLTLQVGTLDAEKAAMQRGDVSAIIVVPAGLQNSIAAKTPVALGFYTDPSKSTTSQVVQSVLGELINNMNLALAGGSAVLSFQSQSLSSTTLSNIDYLVPSILAMALMQLGVFAAIPLVEQREKGILKRIGATPLPRWQLVGSNVLLRLIVAAVDTVLILGVGMVVFNVQITGNVFAMAGFVFLGAGAFLALGFALAAFLKTEEQANGVVQVVQMPLMFLSGIFFPFDFMPDFLRNIARLLPLTYLGDALRQVMVNGTQVAPIGVDLAILTGWLVVCLGIAARSFRWD
jgi:ABC-2 type transport system permease protein